MLLASSPGLTAGPDATAEYPHPVERARAVLTSGEAPAGWLMPSDFEPPVGQWAREPGQ
jgi:hypothetical protein